MTERTSLIFRGKLLSYIAEVPQQEIAKLQTCLVDIATVKVVTTQNVKTKRRYLVIVVQTHATHEAEVARTITHSLDHYIEEGFSCEEVTLVYEGKEDA